MQRKQSLIILGIATLALPLLLGCGAAQQSSTPTAPTPDKPEFLFVQTADSVTLADGVLTMGGVNPATIYFSDRPDRVAGHLTTDEFVATWGDGDDSFASNPPNATMSILTGDEPQEIDRVQDVVAELDLADAPIPGMPRNGSASFPRATSVIRPHRI